MPGRNDAALGSGGKDINAKPAPTHNAPTISRQRHASRCHEAGYDGTQERDGFATTFQKATKRDPTVSNDASDRALPTLRDGCVEMDHAKASPEGQTARAGARQDGTTQQIHPAAPANKMPRSESQQQERRVDDGALRRFQMEPIRNNASSPPQRPTCQPATPQKLRAAPGIK